MNVARRVVSRFRKWSATVVWTLLPLLGCRVLPSSETYQTRVLNDEQMATELEAVRQSFGQPALAAALIHRDAIVASAIVGQTMASGGQPVQREHRLHIGSTTKSFTSLLLAMLVREGQLRYNMTLEEALPGTPMREEYRRVTLHDLLLSRAGIIPYQRKDLEPEDVIDELEKRIPATTADPQEQRRLVTEFALARRPVVEPMSRSVYSNVGWGILGHVIERRAGSPYEVLLRDRIFKPLGMVHARVGAWPASGKEPHQPRGHYAEKEGLRAQPIEDPYVFPSWMNPAGGIHCSIGDLALYAREHLMGLKGKGSLLDQSGYREIHSIQGSEKANLMYQGATQTDVVTLGYAWAVVPLGKDLLSAADGSGGTFYARIVVLPALDLAFAGFTNAGNGEPALSESISRLTGLPWSEAGN